MRILYFKGIKTELGKKIYHMIQGVCPGKAIEHYEDVMRFSKRLDEKTDNGALAVILAADEESLIALYSIKHRLYKVPFLLILPDRERDTIAMGYRFKPQALCYIDSTQHEIRSTFRYMVESPKQSNRFIEAAIDYWRTPIDHLSDSPTIRQAA